MTTEQHHAIIATTWCIDTANAMSQWCAGIPDMRFVRTDSLPQGSHTLALLLDDDGEEIEKNKAVRDLFMKALLEDDHAGEEHRWTYAEVSYGIAGPSIGRAFPGDTSEY